MKVLVIGDIHCRKFWRQCINNNIKKVEKVVFLGDYLDPYPKEIKAYPELMEVEDLYDTYNALEMLNHIISLKKGEPDKYILLTGNHTDSYIWSNFKAGTRTDNKNWKEYHNFFLENLNYFNLVWVKDNVIFSHAGISEDWAYSFLAYHMEYDESALEGISYIKECAEVLRDTPLTLFNNHYIRAISEISYYRNGDFEFGSCEWADLREHINLHETSNQGKIIPIGENGIYQVFGHTQLRDSLITDKWSCLDCRKGFIIDTMTYEITECEV